MPGPQDPWPGPRRPTAAGSRPGLSTATAQQPDAHVTLPALPVAARWARRRGGEVLRRWGLEEEVVDTVTLLVSELVTNALRHGVPRAGDTGRTGRCGQCASQICMVLRRAPGCVYLEVFDGEVEPLRFGTGSLETAFGRGLMIVANLSEEQSYYLPPTGGKVVWCKVATGH